MSMMNDLERRILPLPPRLASAGNPSKLPPPDLVAGFSKPGGDAVQRMHDRADAALVAIAGVEAGRPGGSRWREAEDAAVRQDDPQLLADLIAGDGLRYAQAHVSVRRCVSDLDAIREDAGKSFASAAVKVDAEIRTLAEAFAVHAKTGWVERSTGAGAAAFDKAKTAHDQIKVLVALRRWLDGRDRDFMGSCPIPAALLDEQAVGFYNASAWTRVGTGDASYSGWLPADYSPDRVLSVGAYAD